LTKNDNYCGMVLVSDGKETCNGDPEAEAAKLAKNPKLSFGIHVVGFDVQPEERKSLEAIAKAGKGEYYNAETAEELGKSLDEIAKDLSRRAKPPVQRGNRRAVRLLSPKVELPPMKELLLVPEKTDIAYVYTYKLASIDRYGAELRIPSSSAKYDLIWVPKEGKPIRLVKGFTLPERKVVDVKPEEHAGMVQVNGEGTARSVVVAPTGTDKAYANTYAIQTAKKFGEVMAVPAGDYDVFVNGDLVEEKLKVEPGKLQELD